MKCFIVMVIFYTAAVTATEALAQPTTRPAARVLKDLLPNSDPAMIDALSAQIEQAGYQTSFIDSRGLSEPTSLDAVDLLILPNGTQTPLITVSSIEAYLKRGGHLIVCGLPLWDARVAQFQGTWTSEADYTRALGGIKPEKRLVDFEREDLTKWNRASNDRDPAVKFELDEKTLHVVIPNLTGWDTFGRKFDHPFDAGQTLTCFRARGGKETTQLALEWTERDGSRWIATVPISNKWETFALPPEAFAAWQPPEGRGGANDHLRVENAACFSVGLAFSHTDVPRGRNEFYFDTFGTAKAPFAAEGKKIEVPALESLCPRYKTFAITQAHMLTTPETQSIVSQTRFDPPHELLGLHPRAQAAGYDKHRPWRWQPLLEARAGSVGVHRGAVAAMHINLEGPFRDSVWAGFTPTDAAFYRQPVVLNLIAETATALRRDIFLQEGGSAFYTVFPEQPVKLGAHLFDPHNRAATCRVRISVHSHEQRDAIYSREFPASNPIETEWIPPSPWPNDGYVVTTQLTQDGRIIDSLSHDLYAYAPKPQPDFIHHDHGQFTLNGKPWKVNGVNYMPSSGIGLDDGEIFEHWIGAAAYDPEVIDRDLRRIKDMNLNAISIFIYRQSMEAQNLLDLLRRCDELGLKVNLSLRPGDPMNFRWKGVSEMIEFYSLKDNDTIFAYDLGWETSHYTREHQQAVYGSYWQQWLSKRYGSVEAAEKAWDYKAPREAEANGRAGVPLAAQLVDDGPWRKMINDYRAFLDLLAARDYGKARDLVRSIDKNHAVSFRMTIAGDPTARDPNQLPFDFWGLRNAVDIWEPEAYGRIGDWPWVKHGLFTAAYARLCDPDKPLVWAEMGVSNWDATRMQTSPTKLDFQARFHQAFYRMLQESGADGVFFWWYPGGYRTNEKSDFGIINPDGTDRPVTKVIRDQGPKFLAAVRPPSPDVWIEVDRDRDSRGLYGIYDEVQNQFWKLIADQRHPGLRWIKQPDR